MTWVGRAVPLKEDTRLVAGRGRFLDDLDAGRALHVAMLRSPHAHARIVSIDTAAAHALPGVLVVLTGADVAAEGLKPIHHIPQAQSPRERVRPFTQRTATGQSHPDRAAAHRAHPDRHGPHRRSRGA